MGHIGYLSSMCPLTGSLLGLCLLTSVGHRCMMALWKSLSSSGGLMARSRMSRSRSKRAFRNGVNREHSKNRLSGYFMRGGIRL